MIGGIVFFAGDMLFYYTTDDVDRHTELLFEFDSESRHVEEASGGFEIDEEVDVAVGPRRVPVSRSS